MSLDTNPMPLEGRVPIGELVARIHREVNNLHKMILELEARVDTAFPGADLHRHRTDHEEIHEIRRNKKVMWESVRDKTLQGVVWAALVSVAMAAWAYLKIEVRK